MQQNYSYIIVKIKYVVVEGAGFEPAKAEPSDLQSDPFDRSGTPPKGAVLSRSKNNLSMLFTGKTAVCGVNY